MIRKLATSTVAALVMALPATALAQSNWYENFDSYTVDTRLDNVGGWFGWENTSGSAGTVTDDQALSPNNSFAISNTLGDDAVHPFTGYDSGLWDITAYQYIPTGFQGTAYFIVNNQYTHAGDKDWAVQIEASTQSLLGPVVTDTNRTGSASLPVIFDQWVPIRVRVDLDSNFTETYYNEELLSSGLWDEDGDGVVEIQNLDLFGPNATAFYYDNLSIELVPEPTTAALALVPLMALARRRR